MAAPSEADVAKARETLLAAQKASGDPVGAKLGALVISEAFGKCYADMVDAQSVAPANTELSYAISMMARLRDQFTPR